ncbi:MAG: MFS transporter [Luteibaculaceae bacterium]
MKLPNPEHIQAPGDKLYTSKFLLLCFANAFFFGSFNMIIPELPGFIDNLGGGEKKGLIIGLFTLAAGISRPFSGKITDSIGRKPVMIFGVAVSVICTLFYPITATVFTFLLLRFFHGFSTGFTPTGATAFLADITPSNRRGEAMGIMGFSGSVGMAIGPAFGSFIANSLSLNFLFYASALAACVTLVVFFRLEETLVHTGKFKRKNIIPKKNEIIEKSVWLPSLMQLLTLFSFGILLTVIPDFSLSLGIENKGLFFTIMLSASLMVRLFAGKVSDIYGRASVMLAGNILLVISMVTLALTTTPKVFFIAAAIYGTASGISSPTVFAWTADLAKPNAMGKAMGTMFIALEAGIGLGAVISGYIFANKIENLYLTFTTGAVLGFIGIVVLLFHLRHLRIKRKLRFSKI